MVQSQAVTPALLQDLKIVERWQSNGKRTDGMITIHLEHGGVGGCMMDPLNCRTQGIRMHFRVPNPLIEGLLCLNDTQQDAFSCKIGSLRSGSSRAVASRGVKITQVSGTSGFSLSPPIRFNTGSVSSHHNGATLCMSSLQINKDFKPVTPKLSRLHLSKTGHDGA